MVSDLSLQNIDKLIINEIDEHIDNVKLIYDLAPKIELASQKIINTFKTNKKLLICGNGGSSADSQHFSSELIGKYEKIRDSLAAISLSTDTSLITSVGNDYSFEDIFSRQVEGIGNKDDILILISTSGQSKNINKAINVAKRKGIFCIGLLGRDGGEAKKKVDLDITVNSKRTCRIQEMHSLIIHILCGLIEKNYCL